MLDWLHGLAFRALCQPVRSLEESIGVRIVERDILQTSTKRGIIAECLQECFELIRGATTIPLGRTTTRTLGTADGKPSGRR